MRSSLHSNLLYVSDSFGLSERETPTQWNLWKELKQPLKAMSAAQAMSDDAKTDTITAPPPSTGPSRARQLRVMLGRQWLVRKRSIGQNVVLMSHLMEEVEALCDRVGIMVKGKLRCLGTIQYLKSSLGKHYEVELAVDPDKFSADPEASSTKIRALAADVFPGAEEEGPPSAGLYTYRVPQESIKIGDVLDALQARKEEVDLVDYSIAQPTLEAVFIRTVLDYSGDERPDLPDNIGARTRLLSQSVDSTDGLDEALDEALVKKKFTGCTRRVHYIIAVSCFILAIVLLLASSAAQFLFIIAIVFLLAMIWGCVGCCCILKKDKYEDDGVTCSDRGDAGLFWWCEP